MPRIRQLNTLFRAIASHDLHTAESIAAQIANDEEKKGHHTAAQLLRGSLRPNSTKDPGPVHSQNGRSEQARLLSNALTVVSEPMRMDD
ncbi:MAG: hypothetical protein JWM16_3619, partial [Verrucomicrobiales bacterium]|nr:hypothetical protein [Verrucomicrobiales bacterium]